ncbi:MAG: hypothetical protein JXQ96_17300 [Cyclobacteriaceae bacterium]
MEGYKKHFMDNDAEVAISRLTRLDRFLKTQINKKGILFIVWGWAMVMTYLNEYLPYRFFIINKTQMLLDLFIQGIVLFSIGATVYYIFKKVRLTVNDEKITMIYLWVGMAIVLILINLTLFSAFDEIDFALQHPIFMAVIAFTIFITGRVLRYSLVSFGGILFAVLAYFSIGMDLGDQMLMEAIGWFVSFVLPGHNFYRANS